MNRHFVLILGFSIFWAAAAQSAQVLVKPLEKAGWSLYSENDKSWDGWPALVGGLPIDEPRRRNPGFKTASSGANVFVVGYANPLSSTEDGFLAKLNPAGSIVWVKSMSEIMGSLGWSPNDIQVFGDRLYICGLLDQGLQRGFVAKITLEGTLEEYSLFTPGGTGAYARANALAVSTVNGSPSIVVAGDAEGDSLMVQQRQRNAAANVFTGLKVYKGDDTNEDTDTDPDPRSDAFIVRFDENLGATWGTTMGFPKGDDYATAVTADNNGTVYLALAFDANVDYSGSNSRIHQVDGDGSQLRTIYSGGTSGTMTGVGNEVGLDVHFDFHYGHFGMLMSIDTQSGISARIKRMFLPCRLESGENGSANRICDLTYYDGSVYAVGEWKKRLRPAQENSDHFFYLESLPSSDQGYDIFVTRLNATTLNSEAWRFFQSSGEDFAHEMTVDASGVYLAGTASGSLDTLINYGVDHQVIDRNNAGAQKATLGGSSSSHLFWQKMALGDLSATASGHLTPIEDVSAGLSIPTGQRNAGIAVAGQTIVFVGGRESGAISFGPSEKRKTLDASNWSAYAGFLKKTDFSFLEEVTVTIESEFGVPLPHRGIDTVAAGQTIVASVPPEVFEDSSGNIIDAQDATAIREHAVTRRVCTGYQFRNSTVNGTANSVTFVAGADTELTFLWRTDHALEIESDIENVEGLTSTAAGNPEPSVQKHWIRENEPFTAFIDGADEDSSMPGVRWRSIGFVAEGCVASAQQVNSGSFVSWSSYQDRQQTKEITVGSPGRIIWRWQKEYSLRVAVNSSVANGAPETYSNRPNYSVTTSADGGRTLSFDSNVELLSARVRTSRSWSAANRPNNLTFIAGGFIYLKESTATTPDAGTVIELSRTASGAFSNEWLVTGLADGNWVQPPYIDFVEVTGIAYNSGGPNSADIYSGTGEYWFAAGAEVTARAPASVSSGVSTLALKGYTGGQGSIVPFAVKSVTEKAFTITEPSNITWDYARAIYPETIYIGSPLTFSGVTGTDATRVNKTKKPSGGNVSQGPSGSGWGDMQVWDEVDQKLYALQPGKFTVEFENTSSPDDAAQNVIVEIDARWPDTPHYTHILETPPVNLDPSSEDSRAFVRMAHTESQAQVSGSLFSAVEPGRSALIFSERSGGEAIGNLEKEPLIVKVVDSIQWETSAGDTRLPATIGESVTSADHQGTAVGHNGFVIHDLAPVNGNIYNRQTLDGPIIPVNGREASAANQTDIHTGTIIEFASPDDLLLDPSKAVIAVNHFGDTDLEVNGVTFLGDRADPSISSNGVTVTTTASQFVDDYASAPTFSGGSGNAASNLAEIMRDIRWEGAPNPITVTISGLQPGGYYHLQLLTNEGSGYDRRFDISVNDHLAVDNYTSHGNSAVHSWSSSNSFAYTGEFAADPEGKFTIKLAQDLGGHGPVAGKDHNPILQGLILHQADGVGADHEFAVAWYELRDGIRWPYKASAYDPRWPASPDRIVIASQLGSENLSRSYLDPAGGILSGQFTYDSFVPEPNPLWKRPSDSMDSIADERSKFHHVGIAPISGIDPLWVYTWGWSAKVCLYKGPFNPDKPLENLVKVETTPVSRWFSLGTANAFTEYNVVFSQDGVAGGFGAVSVEMNQGAGVYVYQPTFRSPVFGSPEIYHQPNSDAFGYNPNEEHGLMAPSYLDANRMAAFGLRNDLNRTERTSGFTSDPYVLVQYEDRRNPEAPEMRMKVYRVIEEDPTTLDLRLPGVAQNEIYARYRYLYKGEAGNRLVPPHPLDTVLGGSPIPSETEGENMDGRIAYYEDKNLMPWVVSGDTDLAEDIRAAWYYPLRADFWHPTSQPGDPVSLGELTTARPRNIWYDTVWPDDVAVLKAGETLTFSGGEYATDNNTETPRPQGLPQAVAWQSGKLVFDEANTSLDPQVMGSKYLARVFPALDGREVDLALTSVPSELTPASGNVIVDGLLWRFKQLPASLQERVYYNTSSQKLGVRGLLNGRILGDGDLLAAPGAQIILQPNVLTEEDKLLIKGLASAGDWLTAVDAVVALSQNPQGAIVTGSLGVGLESADGVVAQPANSFGPGLAVITNPDLQDPGTAVMLPDGYVTIAENDHEDLGDVPVAMHVMKITREKYRGSVAVMEPSNVFDEKVSLRHTADFGGDVSELTFQWYLREEDGRDLNPPGIDLPDPVNRDDSAWTLFKQGLGLSEIQLAGSGPTLITDNVVFCRYGYGANPTEWSSWAGAANSREPKTNTDPPFVAQLVPGWVKRVTEAVNLFDARYDDFRNNDAPATYTSALQQAGQRWEGPVAFNPNKDAIENVGLIALYQTVLDRAEDFTIASASGTDGVNTALLNAANRIAGLYTLFGNEAYSDALDPTIGYSTVGGEFGTLAPTIHAFQNQTANLLDEELMLLRGRSEVGARPAYNRLMWNFTNGPGEAAYVLNYGLQDLTNDGFLDHEDGRRLYPQGHGDAWGHYTMALKGYYDLATTENFTWSPRSEKVNIDGVVVNVDYLDERAFAKTAAARARCGAELVDLTYRQAYTENPDGQWQGYQDTNTDRAWGVFETAQRAGTAALFDWMFVNALLPAEDSENAGIRKVDRSTVIEISEIAQHASNIQAKLDMADRGLNPAGLDPSVVPFDIDPVLTDRSHENASTHFEQVYGRATAAVQNALRSFDQANEIALQLRHTEATSETLRQDVIDQDLAYRNEMIEVFGSPYEGMIGSGKAYPAGYKGPDLYLFMYVDQVAAGGDILDPLDDTIVETTIVPGLRNLAADTNPFTGGEVSVDGSVRETVSKYFPEDLELPNEPVGEITLNLPRKASGYALVAPEGWGQRRSPGAIQAAVQELVQAQWRVRMAVDFYESQSDDFQALLRKFEVKSGISSSMIRVAAYTEDQQDLYGSLATTAFAAAGAADLAADITDDTFDVLQEALPKVAGLANDVTAPARGAIGAIKANLSNIFKGVSLAAQTTQYRFELEAEEALLELEQALLTEEVKAELVDILDEIWLLVNEEGDAAGAVVDALETMRAASDRVRTVLEQGQALLEERRVFNTRVASTTTKQRYEDYTFRVFQNEALRKYRSSFDLAARYAYLAGKAYQYELNLPDNHAANATPLLAQMLRTRSLGAWSDGEPVLGNGGLAESLAILKTNFETLKGQLGFNNPDTDVQSFSIRTELARVGMSSRVNADWRNQLESWRVPDLWNYQYQHNGVNYGYVFRRYCRPFAPESAGTQPALVIPFDSTIATGLNWFGKTLAGGDSSFNASSYSTKIRAAAIRFDGYNNTALSQTPQVYLVPVGDDKMFLPDSRTLSSQAWRVVDQRIPAPIPVSTSNLANPDWQPYTGSAHGFFEEIRRFSSFRAYHDAGGWSSSEMLQSGRLVGRSVWNTQWVLIIPNASLLNDPNNSTAGIDTLIHGAPLPGYDQQTAGLTNRDRVGVRDIRILLQTYSVSGN